MDGDIGEASSTLRPFEPLAFTPRAVDEVNRGIIKETDAHAALQSALATHGLSAMTPDAGREPSLRIRHSRATGARDFDRAVATRL